MAEKELSIGVGIANLPPVTVNILEAAQLLGVGESLMRQLAHRRDFPAFKVGNRTLISYDGLRQWAMQQAGVTQEG